MRRLQALKDLGEVEILALVRKPETAQAAYVAVVEENEIRAPLSYYERATLAVAATGTGFYPDTKTAIFSLFAHVPQAKKSKITKFVTIRRVLNNALSFPAAIPERLGLTVATAIEADRKVGSRFADALR